jgi:periplasmic protein CpxP/Spy
MSALTHQIVVFAPAARTVTIAALLGTTFLFSPLAAARADTATSPVILLAEAAQSQSAASDEAAATKGETVEQRVTDLHAALAITADEESLWSNVAQAMRENAAAMQKLTAEKSTEAPQEMTAVADLEAYEKFAQAHLDGVKNLTASFDKLYDAMPDPQKKVADQVFQNFGRKGAPTRS